MSINSRHKLVPRPVFEEGTVCTGGSTVASARHRLQSFKASGVMQPGKLA